MNAKEESEVTYTLCLADRRLSTNRTERLRQMLDELNGR